MKNNRKKKAFTLTELLVVVIVIGVLSAVVLPKFSKVIETRKTTEAEEMMAAVRTEQEKRCSLDKNYTTDAAAVNLASLNTKNFNYTLKNTGIEAASTGKYGYTLKMPSYRDGRLCCDSAEQCAKLNKNYPLCSELTAKADYTSGAECSADEKPDNTPKPCEGSSTQACGCKNGGTQTRTCDTTTGTWSAWSACSISDSCACTGTQPDSSQECNSCGTQTRTVTCDSTTGEWVPGDWGTCSKTVAECTKTDCPDGKIADSSGNCVCEDRYNNTKTYTSCSGKAYGMCSKQVWSSSSGSTGVGTIAPSKIQLYAGEYSWNEETCKCDIDCDPSSVQTYYFKCVERISGGYPNMTSDTYENYGDAYSACVSGKNTNAVYYKYLTGGTLPKDCPSYEDDKGRWVTCDVEDAYHIKYVCSTEPPKGCSTYGFCEQDCLTYIPGH